MIKIFFIYLFMISPLWIYSQNCIDNCTWTISSTDTSNYTVGEGQTLCVSAAGVAKGSIMLSGGTICNAGVIYTSSLNCISGTINNYGTILQNGNLTLTSNSFIFTNNEESTFNVLGDLTIGNAGVSITNGGTVNIIGDINLSAGTITNNGTMNYLDINNTGGTNTNNAVINCCGN